MRRAAQTVGRRSRGAPIRSTDTRQSGRPARTAPSAHRTASAGIPTPGPHHRPHREVTGSAGRCCHRAETVRDGLIGQRQRATNPSSKSILTVLMRLISASILPSPWSAVRAGSNASSCLGGPLDCVLRQRFSGLTLAVSNVADQHREGPRRGPRMRTRGGTQAPHRLGPHRQSQRSSQRTRRARRQARLQREPYPKSRNRLPVPAAPRIGAAFYAAPDGDCVGMAEESWRERPRLGAMNASHATCRGRSRHDSDSVVVLRVRGGFV